jgi:hypothetical protein
MKSGDFSQEVSGPHFQEAIRDIHNHDFVQLTFHPKPGLIAKAPVHKHRMWKEYKGQAYDPAEYDKVDGYWDHEHCGICWFKILDGHTYWANKDAVKLLCDACYQEYEKRRGNLLS